MAFPERAKNLKRMLLRGFLSCKIGISKVLSTRS
jgi:hypothetical protein